MIFDLLMDWEDAAAIVRESGFDGWLAHMNQVLPGRDLYSCGTSWYEDGPKYIAKLRGTIGDAIVGWHQ